MNFARIICILGFTRLRTQKKRWSTRKNGETNTHEDIPSLNGLHHVVDEPAVSLEALAWGFHFFNQKKPGDLITFNP